MQSPSTLGLRGHRRQLGMTCMVAINAENGGDGKGTYAVAIKLELCGHH